MKNKNFPLVLLVIVLVIALFAALYVSDRLPSYNGFIDSVFSRITTVFSSSEKNGESVNRVESEKVKGTQEKSEDRKTLQKDIYEVIDNGYTLSSAGKYKWYFESSWPFVTNPIIVDDGIVTVTAEPAFITLSYETGELVLKEECPVYPGEYAVMEGNILVLTGRDGKTYRFMTDGDHHFTDMRSQPENMASENVFLKMLAPDLKTTEFISGRIREWSADDARILPDVQLYTGHINREGNGNFWAQQNGAGDTFFYVFTPDKQGVYQIGLADENGVWMQANAFVAVFSENGEMKQVSIDYVANKPQVKLHLSDSEIYYIVAGWAKDMNTGTETWLQIAESR